MRVLKWLFAIVAVLALVLVGGAYLLPRDVTVTRSMEIDAPPAEIFPHLNSLKAAVAWSPWMGIDPEMEQTFTGPDEGVGAKLDWVSDHPDVGNGTQEIIGSVPDSQVQTALDFGPMGQAVATYDLAPSADATTVTWMFETDMGMNPMGRWMGLMMDDFVGPDFERGLTNLKGLVEG